MLVQQAMLVFANAAGLRVKDTLKASEEKTDMSFQSSEMKGAFLESYLKDPMRHDYRCYSESSDKVQSTEDSMIVGLVMWKKLNSF